MFLDMAIKDRLKEYRQYIEKNQEEFAKLCGLTQAAVSHYESGKREPDYQALRQILKNTQVDPRWLLEIK